jgi:hypothetical protein
MFILFIPAISHLVLNHFLKRRFGEYYDRRFHNPELKPLIQEAIGPKVPVGFEP